MNLINVEELFLSIFDVKKLKEEARLTLIDYLKDDELRSAFEAYLPQNITFDDLIISYKRISIILAYTKPKWPIFRIRHILSSPSGLDIFWYDYECDDDGNPVDDYFDSFIP